MRREEKAALIVLTAISLMTVAGVFESLWKLSSLFDAGPYFIYTAMGGIFLYGFRKRIDKWFQERPPRFPIVKEDYRRQRRSFSVSDLLLPLLAIADAYFVFFTVYLNWQVEGVYACNSIGNVCQYFPVLTYTDGLLVLITACGIGLCWFSIRRLFELWKIRKSPFL